MFGKFSRHALASLCIGMSFSAVPALAQIQWNTPVAQEGAKGIPVGGFRLFPSLDVSANYDDNIYRTQTDTKNDFFFAEIPGFLLQSQWSRHELDLYGSIDADQYLKYGSEDNNNMNVGGDGRLDVVRGLDLAGGGSYSILHLARTSPDQPGNAKDPTEFTQTLANAAIEYHPYHFGFTLGGNYTRWVYDPTKLIGAPDLSNTDRNEDYYVGFAKASYEFSPGYAAFVQANINTAHFDVLDTRTLATGINRDGSGESYNVGLDMLVTDLVKGEIFVGYLDERFKAFNSISGFNWGANVTWNPTPLWSVSLTGSRTLNGTVIAGAAAEDDQVVGLGANYDFRRNIVLQASVGYTDADFNGSPRDDKYANAGVGIVYLMNEHVSVRAAYAYQHRNSSIAGQDFGDNTLSIALNFHI